MGFVQTIELKTSRFDEFETDLDEIDLTDPPAATDQATLMEDPEIRRGDRGALRPLRGRVARHTHPHARRPDTSRCCC